MIALGSLCANVGVGFTFGAYGVMTGPMVAELPASRALASAGLSLCVATLGLLAPIAAWALRRWSIRRVFAAGFLLLAAAWALAGCARSAWQFVLAFGIVGGMAGVCLVVVPPMTLVNNWFVSQRGRAAGIVMAPVLLMVVPSVLAAGVAAFGWRRMAFAMALFVLLLTPLTALVIDRPEKLGQRALGADDVPGAAAAESAAGTGAAAAAASAEPVTRDPLSWPLMIAGGVLSGASVAVQGHLIAFAMGRGIALTDAAFLLTIAGAAGLAGAFLGGIVADRMGGGRALAMLGLLQCIAWPCLLLEQRYGLLAVWVAIIGMCANAILPVAAALFASLFGGARFAQAMGLYAFVAMPFNFLMPLMAGILYDIGGSYRVVFLTFAILFAVVAVIGARAHRVERVRRTAPVSA